MVVTRKTPLVPPAPSSRTSSSQAMPRNAKAKIHAAPNVQGADTGDLGTPGSSSGSGDSKSGKGNPNDVDLLRRKLKSRSKSKKDKNKSRTFGDFIMYLFLTSFVIYTIRVCPTDFHHDSPVCHGLSKYRELVLEPYVFPVFHRALSHRSIAPHVERVAPYVNAAVRIGRPIIRRTRMEWNSRFVPQWNKRIVPWWNKHIVRHLVRVDQKVEPYRSRLIQEYTRYSNFIMPHLQTAATNIRRWQRRVQPYAVLAANKTYRGYQAVKPYVKPIWKRIKAGVHQSLLFARKQRVLFVDPHVARMWEKVKELSSGKPKSSGTINEEPAAPRAAVPVTKMDTHMSKDEAIPHPTPLSSAIPKETEMTASVATTSSAIATPPTTAEGTESPKTMIESFLTASSTGSIVVLSASSIVPEVVEPTLFTTTSAIVASTLEVTSLDITGPSMITHEPIPTPLDPADINLDEFARELGLEDIEADDSTTTAILDDTINHPPVETESEEQKAERERRKDIDATKQRADINKRHTKWEKDLNELVKSKRKSVRKALVAIRKAAAVELKEDKQIRAAMDGAAADAEKYLKGADAYLKMLKAETKTDAVKLTVWDKLIGKVDTKFRDSLKEIETVVNEWYTDILNKEAQEVQSAVAEVRDLAGDAQSDLGMDYSWLPGVTYADWQRYHDLMRVSENFTELANSIQKGTHPSPPINPVVDVLEQLESEHENILDSFETRLGLLKHDGEQTFSGHSDNGHVTASTAEPKFSILPVPENKVNHKDATGDIPIIGRSSEEIADALRRAGGREAGSQGVKAETEEVVESLAQDAPVEAHQMTPTPAAYHVEL